MTDSVMVITGKSHLLELDLTDPRMELPCAGDDGVSDDET